MGSLIATEEQNQSAKTLTTIIYGLQALGFFAGITMIVAVIINYVKKEDVRGTWLESHFQWQIRTFWYSLIWAVIGLASTLIVIGYLVLALNVIWVIYRVVKGWLRLNEDKSMYASN